MAWIESHQALEKHPKVLHLMTLMEWDLDRALGKLHRFWWWCVDYAEDGDLRKFNDGLLASAVALNGEEGGRFVTAMVEACWLDREPYFRVHDWWDYIGRFLQTKYKHHPEKWQRIKKLYEIKKNRSRGGSLGGSGNTKPPKPKPPKPPKEKGVPLLSKEQASRFARFWAAYPKKKSKGEAEKAWRALNPSEALLSDILAGVEKGKRSKEWLKNEGEFIPYPATWLRARGWEDEGTENLEKRAEELKELEKQEGELLGKIADIEQVLADDHPRADEFRKELARKKGALERVQRGIEVLTGGHK